MAKDKKKKKKSRNVITTPRQKMAIDLILSGNAKSQADAMRKAGYEKSSTTQPKHALMKRKGVQKYLARLNEKSKRLYGEPIQDKVIGTYFEALNATKLYGKDSVEHPDHSVRIQSADRFTKFFGWEKTMEEDKGKYNQFNFFNVDQKKAKKFHERLKKFIKKTQVE